MSQNPSLVIPAAEQPTGAAGKVQITDEFLADLRNNPSKANELDRATRKEVLKRLAEVGDDGDADFGQTPPKVEKAAEEKPPVEDKKVETPAKPDGEAGEKATKGELPLDIKAARKRHQEAVDEANRWEQKLKTAEERRKKAKEAFESIAKSEVKPPDDFLDDKYQTELKTRLERTEKLVEVLKNQLEERDKEEFEDLAGKHQVKEEDRYFSEIETLQARFEELKTKRPIKQINAEYAGWVESLVTALGKQPAGDVTLDDLRQEAMARYESDQAFRESVRVKPPEEMDKLRVILNVHHRKMAQGGSYKAAYLDLLDEEGVLEEVVQKGRREAAKEAAQATVSALKRKEEEITTLAPNEGSSRGSQAGDDLSPQAAWQFLEAIQMKLAAGHKLTDAERAKAKLIRETFGKAES